MNGFEITNELLWLIGVFIAGVLFFTEDLREQLALRRALRFLEGLRSRYEAWRLRQRQSEYPFVVIQPRGGINGSRARMIGRVSDNLGIYELENGSKWHLCDRGDFSVIALDSDTSKAPSQRFDHPRTRSLPQYR